jgi:hypothetical protein
MTPVGLTGLKMGREMGWLGDIEKERKKPRQTRPKKGGGLESRRAARTIFQFYLKDLSSKIKDSNIFKPNLNWSQTRIN